MPDGTLHTPVVDEAVEFTIRIACECYCSLDLMRVALHLQPVMYGALAWGVPKIADSKEVVRDSEFVLIVCDKDSLELAMDRSAIYKQTGRQNPSHLIIYLRDEEEMSADEISGLVFPRKQLAACLSGLTRAVFEPVIPHGLVCVDWADTCHILEMDGQVVIAEASGSRLEKVIESAMIGLRQHAAGRAILGMQASIFCSTNKLSLRHVHDLLSVCRQEAHEDATLILAAPMLDCPDSDDYEVRLFARVTCN